MCGFARKGEREGTLNYRSSWVSPSAMETMEVPDEF
jgi:hypothetical protein